MRCFWDHLAYFMLLGGLLIIQIWEYSDLGVASEIKVSFPKKWNKSLEGCFSVLSLLFYCCIYSGYSRHISQFEYY